MSSGKLLQPSLSHNAVCTSTAGSRKLQLVHCCRKHITEGALDPGRQHDAVEAYELLVAAVGEELSAAFREEAHKQKGSLADLLPGRPRDQQRSLLLPFQNALA